LGLYFSFGGEVQRVWWKSECRKRREEEQNKDKGKNKNNKAIELYKTLKNNTK
jgi:hypothetical protein